MTDKSSYRSRKASRREQVCSCCCVKDPCSWICRGCGLTLCQCCMEENFWGLSCNGITWQCSDCGESNTLGNQ